MIGLRVRRCLVAVTLLAGALPAQSLPDLVAELLRPDRRSAALAELVRRGAPAAKALAGALVSSTNVADAGVLAQALADFGRGTAAVVPELVKVLPKQSPGVRDALLHALGNGLLDCSDEHFSAFSEVVQDWAQRGLFYSESADTPTFAWYEYVRLRKRIELRRGGLDVDALLDALVRIRKERTAIAHFMGLEGTPADQIGNLGRFGQHGTRESIEAIAELALDAGLGARPIAKELADYLSHELPRPGEVITEQCAGYGESPPVDLPEVKLPTRWHRDPWRFAVARVVLAHDDDAGRRLHALRHLLHAPSAAERREALARVRDWPRPWTAFLPELAACLGASDRAVVRDALILLGVAGESVEVAAEPLRRLAAGDDRELAARARAILDRQR